MVGYKVEVKNMSETDHQRIKNWLVDGEWHCSTELDFMRDARKRISELNDPIEIIAGIPCDGRCGQVHKSKNLKMRRLIQPLNGPSTLKISDSTLENSGFRPRNDKMAVPTPLFNFHSYNFKH